MSNYIKATNFASKDALPTGNPLKTVSGTEIDDEFAAIASAVSTKANIASPILTGAPAAPTAAVGTNNTQIATTAYVMAASPTLGVNGVNVNGTLVTGRTIYVDTDAPSGGANGDIWFEY